MLDVIWELCDGNDGLGLLRLRRFERYEGYYDRRVDLGLSGMWTIVSSTNVTFGQSVLIIHTFSQWTHRSYTFNALRSTTEGYHPEFAKPDQPVPRAEVERCSKSGPTKLLQAPPRRRRNSLRGDSI